MSETTLRVEILLRDWGFVGRWDDPIGGGITPQGDRLADLHAMAADAVKGCFEPGTHPRQVRRLYLRLNRKPDRPNWGSAPDPGIYRFEAKPAEACPGRSNPPACTSSTIPSWRSRETVP